MFRHFDDIDESPRFTRTSTLSPLRSSSEKPEIGHEFVDKFMDRSRNKHLFFELHAPHKIISDDEDCKVKINNCIDLLKRKSPKYYSLFCLFNKTICVTDELRCAAYLGRKNYIGIGRHALTYSDAFLASVLIHETVHFWQWAARRSDYWKIEGHHYATKNQALEIEAIKYQLEALKELGGEEHEVHFLEKQRGTHAGISRFSPW